MRHPARALVRSSAFVERYHSADVIAGQYLSLYCKLLDGKFSGGLRATLTTGSETCRA